jgi:hypothetical protein
VEALIASLGMGMKPVASGVAWICVELVSVI